MTNQMTKHIRATIKQRNAVAKLVETRGSVSAAMRQAGYTDASAKNPSNLTNSKGFQALMATYLPDEKLLLRHEEIIDSGEDKDAVKALDMAYKLKGSYAAEKSVNINIDGTDELKSTIAKQLEAFRGSVKP